MFPASTSDPELAVASSYWNGPEPQGDDPSHARDKPTGGRRNDKHRRVQGQVGDVDRIVRLRDGDMPVGGDDVVEASRTRPIRHRFSVRQGSNHRQHERCSKYSQTPFDQPDHCRQIIPQRVITRLAYENRLQSFTRIILPFDADDQDTVGCNAVNCCGAILALGRSEKPSPASIALILGPAAGLTPSTRKGSDYAKRAAAPALPAR
ncbi:hypothetical protein ABE527_20110 [Brucella sp. TWI432]